MRLVVQKPFFWPLALHVFNKLPLAVSPDKSKLMAAGHFYNFGCFTFINTITAKNNHLIPVDYFIELIFIINEISPCPFVKPGCIACYSHTAITFGQGLIELVGPQFQDS